MKEKIIKDDHGTDVKCIMVRVYGIPVWMPVNSREDFIHKCKLSRRLTRHADKAIDQLSKIAKLVDEIAKKD